MNCPSLGCTGQVFYGQSKIAHCSVCGRYVSNDPITLVTFIAAEDTQKAVVLDGFIRSSKALVAFVGARENSWLLEKIGVMFSCFSPGNSQLLGEIIEQVNEMLSAPERFAGGSTSEKSAKVTFDVGIFGRKYQAIVIASSSEPYRLRMVETESGEWICVFEMNDAYNWSHAAREDMTVQASPFLKLIAGSIIPIYQNQIFGL